MKQYSLIFLMLVFVSCNFYEAKKISSEEFYEEEHLEIDWSTVDQYPVFKACETFSEKEAQKTCFETTLSQQLTASINATSITNASQQLGDTILVRFSITKQGNIIVKELFLDSITKRIFPKIDSLVRQALVNTTLIAPAYKRGIPVDVAFTLPLILQTE